MPFRMYGKKRVSVGSLISFPFVLIRPPWSRQTIAGQEANRSLWHGRLGSKPQKSPRYSSNMPLYNTILPYYITKYATPHVQFQNQFLAFVASGTGWPTPETLPLDIPTLLQPHQQQSQLAKSCFFHSGCNFCCLPAIATQHLQLEHQPDV